MPYKRDSIVYPHFSHYRPGTQGIIIAQFDGDPDLYSVDTGSSGNAAMASVKQMYLVDYDRLPDTVTYYENVED